MTDHQTITAREAIEQVLAQRAADQEGFVESLLADPDAVLRPIVTDVLGDDGELDLGDVTLTAHVEDERHLHFVVPAAGPEVSGYVAAVGSFDLLGAMRSPVRPPVLAADCSSTDTTKHTDSHPKPTTKAAKC